MYIGHAQYKRLNARVLTQDAPPEMPFSLRPTGTRSGGSCRAIGKQLETCQAPLHESQGQNLALLSIMCRIRSGAAPVGVGPRESSTEPWSPAATPQSHQGSCAYTVVYGRPCRGTSLIRKPHPVGPYSRTMPRALWWSGGGYCFL